MVNTAFNEARRGLKQLPLETNFLVSLIYNEKQMGGDMFEEQTDPSLFGHIKMTFHNSPEHYVNSLPLVIEQTIAKFHRDCSRDLSFLNPTSRLKLPSAIFTT